ncbi:MAG TPA: MBL fold metallo-hydrolase [Phycisphaerae bacterium]|nr:MBL fold metallo-hydrolase [Phycisphaerae bacterium]
MLTVSLQSGSNGNCIYVEAGDVRLLFDAGISGKQAAVRLAARGRDIHECTALILSHEHSDHVCCAGIFQRKFKLPVYCTRSTYRETQRVIGPIEGVRFFDSGDTLEFGSVRVHTLRTPHDGVDSVCFMVEHEGKRLGIFTDLGHPFAALRGALASVDAAYLESNYDPDMLWNGGYTPWAKARIAGDSGHLSNDEAADMTKTAISSSKLKWLSVAHLSHENNVPELALEAQRTRVGAALPVFVASRYGVGEMLEV